MSMWQISDWERIGGIVEAILRDEKKCRTFTLHSDGEKDKKVQINILK